MDTPGRHDLLQPAVALMPFLMVGAERYELRTGTNTLGGRGDDAVVLPAVVDLPPAAQITVEEDGTSVVQRLAPHAVIRVDGEPLSDAPRPLRHGARLDVQKCALTYSGSARRTATGGGRHGDGRGTAAPTELVPAFSPSAASGRLVELGTGRTFHLPGRSAVIGRHPASDVVLTGTGVSRRHAVVRAGPDGFTITDESVNGTYVNGARCSSGQLLGHGDLVQIGADEFRFESHAAQADPDARPQAATEMLAALPPSPSERPAASPAGRPPSPSLGSLHVTRGALLGKAFQLERPVCAIGRAEHNDVRVTDSSVSAAHATLLLKGGTWYVVDLRSANGTYVDGYRVGGERALHGACTIRVGTVKLEFQPPAHGAVCVEPPRRATGLLQRLARLW